LFDIRGQTAVVTGASAGLGAAFAETLAGAGVNLVLGARRYERLVKASEDLSRRFGVDVTPVETDVTREEEVVNMVGTAVRKFGSVEILVNNAGITGACPSVDMDLQDWKKVIDVNLTGLFLCARTAAREMIKKKYGRIINIASIYGAVADIIPIAHYYASKGAVINLTRALAVEWAAHGLNVNAIAPAHFPSEMSTWPRDKKLLNHILGRIPLGRTGELNDLKGTLIYLASQASNYLTGQTIFLDGGWTAI
jgi:gluconate 5-dehydrogenase